MNEVDKKSNSLEDFIRGKDFEFDRDELVEAANLVNGSRNIYRKIGNAVYNVLKEQVEAYLKKVVRPFNKKVILNELKAKFDDNQYVSDAMLSDAYDDVFENYYKKGLIVDGKGENFEGNYFITENLLISFKEDMKDFEEDLLYIDSKANTLINGFDLVGDMKHLDYELKKAINVDKSLNLENKNLNYDDQIKSYNKSFGDEYVFEGSYSTCVEIAYLSYKLYLDAVLEREGEFEQEYYKKETIKHLRNKNDALEEVTLEECIAIAICLNHNKVKGNQLVKKKNSD